MKLRQEYGITTYPFKGDIISKKQTGPNSRKKLTSKLGATAENYEKFVEIVKQTSRKCIPRGCRTRHIPGLIPELSEQFQKYTELYNYDPFNEKTIETGDQLMEEISNTKITHL